MMDLIEKKISSRLIYHGSFIDVHEDQVLLPNQNKAKRVVVNHPGAVGILAITQDGKVVLTKQWRYATNQALLEIPAGKLDIEGESPEHCAKRELAEETPYTANEVTLICTFFTSPGFCSEKLYLYLANNIEKNSQLHTEEDEIIEPILMSKSEVVTLLKNNEINDAKSIIALQYWLAN